MRHSYARTTGVEGEHPLHGPHSATCCEGGRQSVEAERCHITHQWSDSLLGHVRFILKQWTWGPLTGRLREKYVVRGEIVAAAPA